ncbi:MAG: hypothetical protein ACFB22_12390 [Rhodothalassiaceae bacterium]
MTQTGADQLTHGSADGVFHSHSYYDVPVFDESSRLLCAHRLRMTGHHPGPQDGVEIGVIDLTDRQWQRVGESHAWSWQQGPLTQWLPHGPRLVWNDREAGAIVARLMDLDSGRLLTLERPVYALDPAGEFALSVDMLRLNEVRPGYGYPASHPMQGLAARPKDNGIWRMPLNGGASRLILSLAEAVDFLLSKLSLRQKLHHWRQAYLYWFNHVKLSPDGQRFTVKLRFRSRDRSKGWNDQMGYSLTADVTGGDLRLLAHGTSHVIWLDQKHLYLWQRDGAYVYEDARPVGRRQRALAPGLICDNAHIRHLPAAPHRFVFDIPYRPQVDLMIYDDQTGESRQLAQFDNHDPPRGPFRCDLHPNPDRTGQTVCVTSLHDGGRQIYLVRP